MGNLSSLEKNILQYVLEQENATVPELHEEFDEKGNAIVGNAVQELKRMQYLETCETGLTCSNLASVRAELSEESTTPE